MSNYNGRINIIDNNINNNKIFNVKPNQCSSYDEALTGTLECSKLSKVTFFSKEKYANNTKFNKSKRL